MKRRLLLLVPRGVSAEVAVKWRDELRDRLQLADVLVINGAEFTQVFMFEDQATPKESA